MGKIISTITSGLGNQLFQYAIARQISLVNEAALYMDLRFYQSDYSRESNRSFKLDKFNIAFQQIDNSTGYALKAAKLLPCQSLYPLIYTLQEDCYHFNPAVLRKYPYYLVSLKGYWHSEKYFRDATTIIRQELTFNNVPGSAFAAYHRHINNATNAVSVHIRRGDYVSHPEFSKTFGFIGLDYYTNAIKLMKEMFPDSVFYVFTDDQQWAKENLLAADNFIFISNTGVDADLDDLHLMKSCDHHIIANSSYSWWGAWLNPSPDKVVIAPKNWFKHQPEWDTRDLLPAGWLKI